VCGDAFHASMNRDPIDGGGPCESVCVWLTSGMNRCRDDCDKLKERRKETCDVDLKGDRETCKGDGIDQGQVNQPRLMSSSSASPFSHDLHNISLKVHIRHYPVFTLNLLSHHPPVRQL
jgi:hypothetical protein